MAATDDGDTAAAGLLVDKLRAFAGSLDPTERELLAALLAPGIAQAWDDAGDVRGFHVGWGPARLPDHLAEVIRSRELRITGW